jgi:two-component system chemotaxis response regulator CheB
MNDFQQDQAKALRRIRVLVVDDSASCRDLLVAMINGDPRLQVAGVAVNGEEAVRAAAQLAPDVVTMDLHMPRMDGCAATRRIMETCPTRVVVVTSSFVPQDVAQSFHALEAGALTVLGKPAGPGHPDHAAQRDELLHMLALMAEVSVVRRWPAAGRVRNDTAAVPLAAARTVKLMAIGASTGGPLALQILLSRLRADFAAPIVIVQHISHGFAEGMLQWLARSSSVPLRIAAHGERMQPGVAYLAPDGAHTTVKADGTIALSDAAPEHGYRPAVSCLFRSVARHCGADAVGVLLTGMGHDGAAELKTLRQTGALTIVQDRSSAVVYGMPGEALRLGAAVHVLAPEAIAEMLNRWVCSRE